MKVEQDLNDQMFRAFYKGKIWKVLNINLLSEKCNLMYLSYDDDDVDDDDETEPESEIETLVKFAWFRDIYDSYDYIDTDEYAVIMQNTFKKHSDGKYVRGNIFEGDLLVVKNQDPEDEEETHALFVALPDKYLVWALATDANDEKLALSKIKTENLFLIGNVFTYHEPGYNG